MHKSTGRAVMLVVVALITTLFWAHVLKKTVTTIALNIYQTEAPNIGHYEKSSETETPSSDLLSNFPINIEELNETVSSSTPTTTVEHIPKPPISKPKAESTETTVTPKPSVTPPQELPPAIPPNWTEINTSSRNALVNIICVSPSGGTLNPISGSGVIISEKGVILTNAHVGQYFLLDKYNEQNFIDCSIRKGSPAYPVYKAELLFISPSWLTKHGEDIIKQDATGTGEYDYALLLITAPISVDTLLPEKFPFLKPVIIPNSEKIGDPVLINAYPAGFLGGITIQTNLHLTSSASDIKEIFTFATSTIDIVTLKGNVNAQKGASGGAVTNSKGELIGLIVTSTDSPQTSGRDLGAITLSYIHRELETELGIGLNPLLVSDLNNVIQEFSMAVKPKLSEFLMDILNQTSR